MSALTLAEFFTEDAIKLVLEGKSKDDVLRELVGLLRLDRRSEEILYKMLRKRENLGSTGIGKGVAIPHCRSLMVNRLRVAFGRSPSGIEFDAIDSKLCKYFFLIVAPPLEISNQYLPVLGKVAQLCKRDEMVKRFDELASAQDFLALLQELNA